MKERFITRNISKLFYVKKTCTGFFEPVNAEKGRLDTFEPTTAISASFKNWRAMLDLKTCFECRLRHGQVYAMEETVDPEPPLHNNCRCDIIPLESVNAGNATKNGKEGADYWLKYYGDLPEYYISKNEAKTLGWRQGKSPSAFVPDKMITGGVYENSNGHLPDAPGRVWREADINYYEGKRNGHRVLWSNDGLIFVTYDHYSTFYEII